MQAINKNLAELVRNHGAGKDRKYFVSLVGSTRSGKSFSAMEYLICACQQMPGLTVDCFRFDQRRHETGLIPDFLTLMQTKFRPLWTHGRYNKQNRNFTFANGSLIRFGGTQDADKLHGPARDIAFFNEVNEHTYSAFNQVAIRTRLSVITDCNPVDMDHPILKMLAASKQCLHVHTTYKDNPHLTAEQVRVIESYDPSKPENVAAGTADQYMHDVYARGIPARREGAVFPNWEITDEWPGREFCERSTFGIDFGFSIDPSVLVQCRLHERTLYIREWIYEMGLVVAPPDTQKEVPSLIGRMRDIVPVFHPDDKIYCDSAQPESIHQLRLAAFNVQAVKKGPGSVVAGVNRLKRFQIKVHRGSTNIQRELRMYSWRKRPDGTYADEPEDRNNHAIDALRYAATELIITNQADPIYIPEADEKSMLLARLKAAADVRRMKLEGHIEDGAIRI